MKILCKIVLCITFIFCNSFHSYSMKLIYKCRYILIDSLTTNDISRLVNLDLRTKSINVYVYNELLAFHQKFEIDTSSFKPQILINEFESRMFFLQTKELLSVDNDSIYISAVFQQVREKQINRNKNNYQIYENVGKPIKVARLAICKSELLGVVVSPTIKEMRKKRFNYFLFLGTLAALSLVVEVISNG